MSTVQIMGAEVPTRTLALVAGGGVLLALLFARRDPAPAAPAPGGAGWDPEFLAITADARADMDRLSAANALDLRRADYEHAQFLASLPSAQRGCVSWDRWAALSSRERGLYRQQVRQGKLTAVPTPTGLCFTPTSIGGRGHDPYVTNETRRGFFGSSSRVRGPAGYVSGQQSPTPNPAFAEFANAALQAYAQYQAGG